jgi:CheY-like chemotaxis protein
MEPMLLVVDDDPDDLQFIRDSMKQINNPPDTFYFSNGNELLNFLAERPLPLKHICITLDINMPGINGIALLAMLKKHPDYKDIPVSIITTSSLQLHKKQCEQYGAHFFFTKPVSIPDWKKIMELVINASN